MFSRQTAHFIIPPLTLSNKKYILLLIARTFNENAMLLAGYFNTTRIFTKERNGT